MAERALAADLHAYAADRTARVDAALDAWLPPEDAFPAILHRAMRYSVFAGGKRLRPLLVIAAAETVGGAVEPVLPTACAVELINTYSLIHDDLPSMDDAALRRGRPACHRVFGEAMAVLAGDALHALAFELLARPVPGVRPEAATAVVREVAAAIGTGGMVGGQVLDLLAERRPDQPAMPGWPGDLASAVADIHRRKTAALIRACVRAGAILCDASSEELEALDAYGAHLGLAYQVIDDVLDEVGEAQTLGKDARRDAASRKLTYPTVYGVERSRAIAAGLTAQAVEALRPLGARGDLLAGLARLLLAREA
ncbi:MAG: polyprenyl synthetase family protein [Armatimonadota bacterium]|nr:polyprenyl synthetase family protein [Armatimonadota bacterium]MDR7447657.1 polyprenyl synthetase family protein [Armatimonadota bacterium]MDR7458992.1 polyprenyl synthetase family protein [Armatimonadota bacterium]MDR7480094.1 polyprenyl synthetase family protein [Armatimonadota bacterium]MDR7489547.1 polyprenyl synthetase family protein [Armatimonadota bacterium]